MPDTRADFLADREPVERSLGRDRRRQAHVLTACMAAAPIAALPFLSVHSLFADDWSWFQIYFTEGPARLMALMVDAAHAAYGPHMVALFELSGGASGLTGNWLSFAFHLINGYLLFVILRRIPLTRRVALLATAIFLFDPFFKARASHTMYDEFLCLYLLSIRCMDARIRLLRWLAPLAMLLSLSLETLMCLEPLRLAYVYRRHRGLGDLVRRCWPFWAVAAAVALWRFGFVTSTGHFSGQKQISLALLDVGHQVLLTLVSFPAGIGLAGWQSYDLLSFLGLAGLALVVLLAWRYGRGWAPDALPLRSWQRAGDLLGFALVLAVAAALPHAITGEHAWPTRFETRFSFVAQIGAVIGLAGLVQLLPWHRVRAGTALLLLAVLAFGSLHDGKWHLYDGYIQRDLQARLRAHVWSDPQPELLRLEIQPASNRTLFRYRCLGANDLNVPLNWLRPAGAPPSFVYETLCGDFENLVPQRCSTSYVDSHACPDRRSDAVYRLHPSVDRIGKASLWQLIGNSLWPRASTMPQGTLQVKGAEPAPVAPPELPPCSRAGIVEISRLLRLPQPYCR